MLLPADEYFPATQVAQPADDVAAILVLYLPATQFVQAHIPSDGPYFPIPQASHIVIPALDWNRPFGHIVHSS